MTQVTTPNQATGGLFGLLEDASRHDGDRPALRAGDAVMTWSQLHDAAADLAGRLRGAGVGPGDRVAVILPNVPAYPIAFFAVLSVGAIVVPLNPLLKRGELTYFFSDSGARCCLVWQDLAAEAEAAGEGTGTRVVPCDARGPVGDLPTEGSGTPHVPADGDTAVILYTSGTTGRAKGAELTHANLRSNAGHTAGSVIEIGPDDVVMGCLPLFHVFGLTCGLLAATTARATLALIPRFEPGAALATVAAAGVTVFEGVPTMYQAMLHHPDADRTDVSSWRVCISGGSAMPVEVMRAFEERFDCRILEGYGLSETSPVASFNMPDRPTRPGTIGRAIPGCEMRLIDPDGRPVGPGEGVGEIVIRGENVMKGYWNKPEETAAAIPDGWFRSGDLATVDGDGYFTIVDRKKDLIIRGGINVYPREIEEVLYEHPAVLEAAVVGIADEAMGEEIAAAVALRPDAAATPEELQGWVRDRLAAYKYPRRVWLVDALPKGPTGKILRRMVAPPD